MDKATFLSSITEIGSLEDIVEVRARLAELSDDVTNIFDTNLELSQKNEELAKDNEQVRKVNMKLFSMVGEPNKKNDDLGEPKPERIEKSFEELYNEK